MKYLCPVCMFPSMPYPPADYNICPCCSTEFGNDDSAFTHLQLRKMWFDNGANWFFGAPPPHWNPWLQLIQAGQDISRPFTSFYFNNSVIARTQTAHNPFHGNMIAGRQITDFRFNSSVVAERQITSFGFDNGAIAAHATVNFDPSFELCPTI